MITLGVNYSQMHDSSACIVRDDELLFAIAEERISWLKQDARFSELAIHACLDFAEISAADLDEICFGLVGEPIPTNSLVIRKAQGS